MNIKAWEVKRIPVLFCVLPRKSVAYTYTKPYLEQSYEGKLKQKLKTWAIFGVLILAACVGVSHVVPASNTVNGKELPIYSVETDEKKVALSFDAAWGDGYSGYKMKII